MSRSRLTLWILVCVGGAALLWVLAPPESQHHSAEKQTPARAQLVSRIPSLPIPDSDPSGGSDNFKKYKDGFTSRTPTVPRHTTLALIAQLRDPRVAHILIDVLSSPEPAGLRRIAAGGLAPYADRPAVIRALASAARSDPDRYVRGNALRSLAAGDSPEFHRTLEQCSLSETDPVVSSLISNLLEESR